MPLIVHATEPESAPQSELVMFTERLVSEGKNFATSPFEVSNGHLLVTLSVIGATALTFAYDEDIQLKLQSSDNPSIKRATNAGAIIGDPFLHLGFAALTYGTAVISDSYRWRETSEMMGEALILADASTFLIKQIVGRGRPSITSSNNEFRPLMFSKDYDSFPSMHTASSFALASVLASTSESLSAKILYYASATFVGFSRMYQNKHWASDIIFGAAIGELSGQIVTRYHASKNYTSLVPQAYPSGAGLALVGKW